MNIFFQVAPLPLLSPPPPPPTPHYLACKYSFLFSLLTTGKYRTVCREDVCTSEKEIPY